MAFDQSLSRSFQLFFIRGWRLLYHLYHRAAERVVPVTQQRFLDTPTRPPSHPRGEEIRTHPRGAGIRTRRTRLFEVVTDGQPGYWQPLGHPELVATVGFLHLAQVHAAGVWSVSVRRDEEVDGHRLSLKRWTARHRRPAHPMCGSAR